MTLHISSVFTYDEDAGNYIQAVEGPAGDNQALEPATRQAINNFVVGCKQDGIWTAIKASCILAGARTLAGALVPLVGTAPTNNNFVAGDYNRKTGLAGDGSTKYLDSNRAGNADPLNSIHQAVFASSISAGGGRMYLSDRDPASSAGATFLSYVSSVNALTSNLRGGGDVEVTTSATGFIGHARFASSGGTIRTGQNTTNISTLSVSAPASTCKVFVHGNLSGYSNARLAFYSIGESLDLTKLDGRVTDLINKFQEVIP